MNVRTELPSEDFEISHPKINSSHGGALGKAVNHIVDAKSVQKLYGYISNSCGEQIWRKIPPPSTSLDRLYLTTWESSRFSRISN